jgi:N-acetylglucosaminyl-diphospho-decaprenol L-rhamnosyltransferase
LTAARKRRPQYFYRSRSRYFAKFYGRFGLWLTNGLWHLGRSLSLFREWFGSKQPHLCEHESRDIWSNGLKPMHYDHDLEWSRSETGESI